MCYECRKPGHIKIDCPMIKKRNSKNKKKEVIAAWDDENSSSDEETQEEVAHLCLTATATLEEENNEVNDSELFLQINSRLETAFSNLVEYTNKLKNKYRKLKAKNKSEKQEQLTFV